MNNRGVGIKMSWVEKNRLESIYMYVYYISIHTIHMYYIACDHEITQAMQFVETSFYLALLHQHKFTKLY